MFYDCWVRESLPHPHFAHPAACGSGAAGVVCSERRRCQCPTLRRCEARCGLRRPCIAHSAAAGALRSTLKGSGGRVKKFARIVSNRVAASSASLSLPARRLHMLARRPASPAAGAAKARAAVVRPQCYTRGSLTCSMAPSARVSRPRGRWSVVRRRRPRAAAWRWGGRRAGYHRSLEKELFGDGTEFPGFCSSNLCSPTTSKLLLQK
jgi:hypothetical protein